MNDERDPVELHIVSDSTGETAARLVLALEAQFPDLEFAEVRHPRVEDAEDLHIAVAQARGRPAVMVYTLVEPELRETCGSSADARASTTATCSDIRSIRSRASRRGRTHAAGGEGSARRAVLQADRGDRVRGEVRRRRRRARARRGGRRPGRRVAHVEDAAFNLPRLPRPQGRERARRARIEPPRSSSRSIQRRSSGSRSRPSASATSGRRASAAWARRGSATRSSRRSVRELDEATALHRRLRCPVIDVSELSVEETAMRIIRLVERNRRTARA